MSKIENSDENSAVENLDATSVTTTTSTINTDISSTLSNGITKGPPLENARICLVGAVVDDNETVKAAKKFNVPVLTSETGAEFVEDCSWTTYFILDNFEGPMFDAIRKSKHRIYGPPALQQIAASNEELPYVNKPIYNFAMKGVITCFTGIRKKDELTRLVNLIHSMGGSIRKELNSRVTHLICNSSSGEKYQYAMTFRLTVIRSDWVYDAWEKRNDPTFDATTPTFTNEHRIKAFEGQRICFFGFPDEEHQHMIDVLKANGGIPTDIDDPDCTHVIISNNADHFPEQILTATTTSPTIIRQPCPSSEGGSSLPSNDTPMDKLEKLDLNENAGNKNNHAMSTLNDGIETIVITPKKSKKFNKQNSDGIVLPGNDVIEFAEPHNISPILQNIEEEEEGEGNSHSKLNADDLNEKDDTMPKRKRDSFDNISMISNDNYVPVFNSAKKPKLIRTGSITRSLRRSMSFAALKNPLSNMIKTRRNSIDPNASISSVTSMESTFSEAVKKPVKDKILSLKDRIMKNSSRTPRSFKGIKQPGELEIPHEKFLEPRESVVSECPTVVVNDSSVDHTDQSNITVQKDAACVTVDTATSQDVAEKKEGLDQPDKHDLKNSKTHIVKSDWFWYTIQNGYADELDYQYGDYLESISQTPRGDRRDSLPMSMNKRKRKRFSIRGAADSFLGASGKRRSSISDAGLSVSGSFLDYTASPSGRHDVKGETASNLQTEFLTKFNSFHFLFQILKQVLNTRLKINRCDTIIS